MLDSGRKPTIKDRQQYTLNGKTKTLYGWSKEYDIDIGTLRDRVLFQKLPIKVALTKPIRKTTGKLYSHNSQNRTLKEWAEDAGISYSTLRRRVVGMNMTVGDAIVYQKETVPIKAPATPANIKHPDLVEGSGSDSKIKPDQKFIYNGEPHTLTEISRDSGVPRARLRERIYRQGLSITEALTKPVNRRSMTYKGKTQSLPTWAKEYGILPATLRARLDKGLELKDALKKNPPKIKTRPKKYLYQGRQLTLRDLGKFVGISYYTLRNRIEKNGMTVKQAVKLGFVDRKLQAYYDYWGKHRTLFEISKMTGVAYKTLQKRVEDEGMTVKEAIHVRKIKKYEYHGREQKLTAWSRELGIKIGVLRYCVTVQGMTIEEAASSTASSTDGPRQMSS